MSFLKKLLPPVALLLMFVPVAASAGAVEDAMSSQWNAAMTGTEPGVYVGQSRGYASFGSLSVRTPDENLRLVDVQMPSIRSSCGGIDILGGGFSFATGDQLVQYGRAVAQNAVSYAFNLALEAVCASCAKGMQDILDSMQELGSLERNSCESAHQLVDGVIGAANSASRRTCAERLVSSGGATDMADAMKKCGNGTRNAPASAPSGSPALTNVNSNVAWEVLKTNRATRYMPVSQREVLMSMTGTVIVQTSGTAAGTVNFIAPAVTEKFFEAFMVGDSSFQKLTCDHADTCLLPSVGMMSVARSSSMVARVRSQLDGILARIQTRQALTSEQIDFVNMVNLPIYRLIRTQVLVQGTVSGSQMNAYAEYIATGLVAQTIRSMLANARSGQNSDGQGVQAAMDSWRQGMVGIDELLSRRESVAASRLQAALQVVANISSIEEDLSQRTSTNLMAAMNMFGR